MSISANSQNFRFEAADAPFPASTPRPWKLWRTARFAPTGCGLRSRSLKHAMTDCFRLGSIRSSKASDMNS